MTTHKRSLHVFVAVCGAMLVACATARAGQTPLVSTPVVDSAHAPVDAYLLHHDGADYFVVAVDTRRAKVDLLLRDDKGTPLETFGRVAEQLHQDGQTLRFATNAGMFHSAGSPVGLHIAGGAELAPLNLTDHADGNFFLQPNGVFWIDLNHVPHVDTTKVFQALPRSQVLIATQSGPMLVIDEALHPAFNAKSTNVNIRSGVGVLPDGRAAFVLSSTRVTFDAFARAFRDGLGVDHALYLDGAISRMYAPDLGLTDLTGHFGGILTISEPSLTTCEPSEEREGTRDSSRQSRDDPTPSWPPPPDSR